MAFFSIGYSLDGAPKRHLLELDRKHLSLHEAAMHLIVLHFGGSENGLVMPSADS